MSKPIISPLSLASYQVKMYFNDILLSTATAFAYSHNGRKHLITNYHVAYGRNPETNQCLDKTTAAIPNRLMYTFYDKNGVAKSGYVNCPEQGNPFKFIKKNDIIADIASFELSDGFPGICINEVEQIFNVPSHEEGIRLAITEPLYVLGYPRGINVCHTPIWKKSSIASEPDLKVDGIQCFYIDTTTREGMSGAPVVYYSHDGVYSTPETPLAVANRPIYKFVGIYSGRDRNDESHIAQLGRVWKKELIEEVINS